MLVSVMVATLTPLLSIEAPVSRPPVKAPLGLGYPGSGPIPSTRQQPSDKGNKLVQPVLLPTLIKFVMPFALSSLSASCSRMLRVSLEAIRAA